LEVQQHTLQSFENAFLSRKFDQNIPKNALFLFLEKVVKTAAA